MNLLVVSILPCCNSNTSMKIVILSIKDSAFLFCFEAGSYYTGQGGLKLIDQKLIPTQPANFFLSLKFMFFFSGIQVI